MCVSRLILLTDNTVKSREGKGKEMKEKEMDLSRPASLIRSKTSEDSESTDWPNLHSPFSARKYCLERRCGSFVCMKNRGASIKRHKRQREKAVDVPVKRRSGSSTIPEARLVFSRIDILS